jgi:hypothetical protein
MQMLPKDRFQRMADFKTALASETPPPGAAQPEAAQSEAVPTEALQPSREQQAAATAQSVIPVPQPRPAPAKPAKPKRARWWIWPLILAGLTVLGVGAWFLLDITGIFQEAAAPASSPTASIQPGEQAGITTVAAAVAPPPIANLALNEAQVIYYDSFDQLSKLRWSYSSVIHTTGDTAQMAGVAGWEAKLCLNMLIRPKNAIAIRYRFSPDAEFEQFLQTGNWGEPSFRRFGMYGGTNPLSDIWFGGEQLNEEPLGGVWQPKPDAWLELLIAMGQDGNFILLTRDSETPNLIRRYPFKGDNSWVRENWQFCAGANRGLINFDDFYLMKFTDFK